MKIIHKVGRIRDGAAIAVTLAVGSGCSSADAPSRTNAETSAKTASESVTTRPKGTSVPGISVVVKPGDVFVAANGAASNPGSQTSPTTLESAITRAQAGKTIWVRGGTYKLSSGLTIASDNNGTSSIPKRLFAYPNEVPVLNFSSQAVADSNRGLTLNGNFWHLKGLIEERAGDNGIYIGGNDNIVELCETRFNSDSGLQLGRAATSLTDISQWPSNNLILNCTSHDNKDPGNENADGFAAKLTSGKGNIFRGCIAHHNIDDGWDFYAKKATGPIGPVLIENCIAYNNGTLTDGTTSSGGDKNGFKLGGSGIAVPHTIRHSVAFNNGKDGFTDNNNPGPITVTNNTGFKNTKSNFNFRQGGTHIFTNNVSFKSGESDKSTGTLTGTSNVFWNKKKGSENNGGTLTVSEEDFVSVGPPNTVGRKADGSPDLGDFLRLKPDSALIKAGIPAGTAIGVTGGQ